MQTYSILFTILFTLANALTANAQDVSVKLLAPEQVTAGDEFEIKVSIAKGGIVSFAKLQLEIPKAFSFDSLKSDSGIFIRSDSQAKYVWDRMPAKDTLFVVFKVTTDPGFAGARGINGSFSFILNEEKEKVSIPTKTVRIIPLVAAVAKINEEQNAVVTQEPRTENEVSLEDEEINAILAAVEAEPVAEIKTEKEPEPEPETEPKPIVKKEEITVAPQPKPVVVKRKVVTLKPRIEFRVQIVASVVKVNITELKRKFNLSEDIQSEFHNGLWKYTVGTHGSYREAKRKIPAYRNEKGVKGAFITAYLNGVRISVADAIKQTK